MKIPRISLEDERYRALRVSSLGGFDADGQHWPSMEHYLVAARLSEADARERLRKAWNSTPRGLL